LHGTYLDFVDSWSLFILCYVSMTSSREYVPTNPDEQAVVPIVYGRPIKVPFEVGGSYEQHGVPTEIAVKVSHQVLKALSRFGVTPDQVVFSGYDSPDDPKHTKKAESSFGQGDPNEDRPDDFWHSLENAIDLDADAIDFLSREEAQKIAEAQKSRPEGQYVYCYGDYETLTDGEDGPLAYAAMGPTPALGVYSFQKIKELGLEGNADIVATPEALRKTMIFEFRPRYVFRDQNITP
jgi:hypothetical protein